MRRWIVLLLVLLLPLKSAAAPGILVAGPAGHAHAAGESHDATAKHGSSAAHAAADDVSHDTADGAADGTAASASADAGADPSHAGCPMFAASAADTSDHTPHDHPCPHLGMASIAATIGLSLPPALPHDRTILPAVPFASITLDVPSPPPTSILA